MTPTVTLASHRARRPAARLFAVALVALPMLAACGSDDDAEGSITVADVWIREPAAGQTTAAVYARIVNDTGHEITLVDATTPITDDAAVNETTMDEHGTMAMGERSTGFPIAADTTMLLNPGGAHVMLEHVDPALLVDPVEVTFVFADGTPAGASVTVEADVRPLDDLPPPATD